MGWATLWATFLQTYLVTLATSSHRLRFLPQSTEKKLKLQKFLSITSQLGIEGVYAKSKAFPRLKKYLFSVGKASFDFSVSSAFCEVHSKHTIGFSTSYRHNMYMYIELFDKCKAL
jgi:hypothetical protein